MNNNLNDYFNHSFQSDKFAQPRQLFLLTRFSLLFAAILRRLGRPAIFTLLFLMVLPLAMVNPLQAQEQPSDVTEPEVRNILPPKVEDIPSPRTEDIFSTTTKDIFSASVFEQPSVCTQSPISYGQTVFGIITTDCSINGLLSKEYTFNGIAGQQINVSLGSYEFVTKLELLNSDGIVISTGISGSVYDNKQITYTFTSSQPYKIRVSSQGQASFWQNTIGGNYYLSLAQGPGVSACTYSLPTTGYGFGTFASSYFVSLTTAAGCPWTAVSNSPSITITNSPASGIGSTTVNFSFTANNSSTPRRGSFSVAGLALSVYQESNLPCSVTAISYGQTKNGDFSTTDCSSFAFYSDNYTFSGTAGDQIAISTIPGTLSPGGVYLQLHSPSGASYSIYYEPSRIPATGNYTLPESGIYTITASANNHFDQPNATGTYTLTLTNAASNYPITGRVTDGTTTTGVPGVNISIDNIIPIVPITTDANGNYSFGSFANGTTHTVTASQTGRTFTPTPRQVTINGGPATANFQRDVLCTYSLNPTSLSVSASGGIFSFNITTNPAGGCPWTAVSDMSWLTPLQSSGNGSATGVQYNVTPNTTTSQRTGIITVNGQTLTVTQAQADPCSTLSISAMSASVVAAGGNGSFNVTSAAGCQWTAVSNAGWLITSGGGTGNGSVLYTAAANTSTSSRTGTITVNGQVFTVTQAAAPACPLSISPTSQIIEPASGAYSFNVFTNSGCPWSAGTSTPWIHISITGGTSNGVVNYTVDANSGTTSRQGIITVNGQTFSVNQKSPANTIYSISGKVTDGTNGLGGVTITLSGPYPGSTVTDSGGNYQLTGLTPANYMVSPSLAGAAFTPSAVTIPYLDGNRPANFTLAVCTYHLSASAVGVPVGETPGGFSVIAENCGNAAWTAASNAPWIIIANEGNGIGTQAVSYFVQRNYGAARSGTIAVNGQIYTITQAGLSGALNSPQTQSSVCSINLSNSSNQSLQVVPYTGMSTASFAVSVTNQGNQPSCQWTARTPNNDWIHIVKESGVNNESVTFSVDPWYGSNPHFGIIKVNGESYKVIQTAPFALTDCNNLTLTGGPGNSNYGATGGVGYFDVGVGATCRWISYVDNYAADWLKVVEGVRPSTGPQRRNFTVGVNTGTEANTGTIVVRNQVFTVNQIAGQTTNCKWEFASTGQNVLAGGGTGVVTVSTGAGCAWTAVSDATSWLHVVGGNGNNNGTVSFTFDANQGAARSGKISIWDQPPFTVTQDAQQACSYTINPGFQSVPKTGATGTIQVMASAACSSSWNTTRNVGWITITSGINGTGSGSASFVAQTNTTPAQRTGIITIAGQPFTVTQAAGDASVSTARTGFDFDGDGKADISVFRPSNGAWYLNQSVNGFTGIQFGQNGDKLVPADYDGDGKTDVAVYRAGIWYIQRSTLGFTGFAFGDVNDIPVPADYDGDGKADFAVFRPSNGVWYIQGSQLGFTGIQFGQNGDKPVAADYDGDGKADIAVYRAGIWYLQRSQLGFIGVAFGESADKPVVGDYDGDGKADIAVFRPSNGVWYLQRSQLGFTSTAFGFGTDLPTPADYDGDGKTDVAVYRDGTWYLQRSTQGFTGVAFGAATDKPVPNAFVP